MVSSIARPPTDGGIISLEGYDIARLPIVPAGAPRHRLPAPGSVDFPGLERPTPHEPRRAGHGPHRARDAGRVQHRTPPPGALDRPFGRRAAALRDRPGACGEP